MREIDRFRHTWNCPAERHLRAVGGVLEHARTPDVWRPGCDLVSTTEMGRRVLERLATVCAHAPKG